MLKKTVVAILPMVVSICSSSVAISAPLRLGYYEIRAMHSSKCLDVPKSSREDGAKIIQYKCGNTTNQRWKLTFKGPLNCADLYAESLTARIVERENGWRGTVQIKRILKNRGDRPFHIQSGRLSVQIREKGTGVRRQKVVTSRPLTSLEVNRKIELNYTRHWNASSANEGEFPPKYILLLNQDPDTQLEECDLSNNQKELNGWRINQMFLQ